MNNDIKKSLLISLHFPPDLGGEQVFYYNLCKNLPGDKIIALAPNHPRAENFDNRQHFTIFRHNITTKPSKNKLKKILKPLSTLKWLSQLNRIDKIVKRHGIELIQAGQILPIGTLAMMYKNRKQVPYIIYAHGLDIMLPQKKTRKKILMKKIIAGAKNIVANSNFTKDELIKLGAEENKIIVVYPCPSIPSRAGAEDKMNTISKKYNLNKKQILLTVGRLVERKGHDKVIMAMPELIKRIPNLVYLIVGQGPYQKKLENLVAKNNLKDYVKFLGKVPAEDLPEIYQMSDIFIMPNRRIKKYDVEGFGIVFIEAGLFGKPVIGGRDGGVPEAIIDDQTGLLVNPNDINDIIEKTLRLLTNPSYSAKLGTQGQQRAHDKFDWADQIEKIKEILTQRS